MRRIVIWIASTVTVVVLLFGYHTSTGSPAAASSPSSTSTPASSSSTPAASGPPSAGSSPSGSSPSGSSSSAAKTSAAKTYTGDVAQTRWGPVQVEITVGAGKVTEVDVLQSPSGNPRDVEINDRALPVLTSETLTAQGADVDMVSGATVTSDGYVRSLQSALDQAGI